MKILIEKGRIESKPSKDKSSYSLSDTNITDSELHIPTIMVAWLVETSSFKVARVDNLKLGFTD